MAVAGTFYSANKEELSSHITTFLQNATHPKEQNIRALIVPHAGYVFSGGVAAEAYGTLGKKYKNIFLIGSSHHVSFDGASIYTQGEYATPLGNIKINQTVAQTLLHSSKYFTNNLDAHAKEYSLEVQLPFLQTIYGDSLQIVPIIIATSKLETLKALAESLEPYFNDENLFVISTDLSHYPSYQDANVIDKKTLEAIQKGSVNDFIARLVKNEESHIAQLQTSACGWSSLLTLMYLTQERGYKYELLQYKNSGDTLYGDKQRVVGYGALKVYQQKNETFLSDNEKEELREIAKLALYEAVLHNKKLIVDRTKIASKLREPLGAFVTLYKNHNLRGCIGRFEPNQPLYEVIIEMAIASALHDTRFLPVTPDELENIELEISVLTPRKKINSLEEIVLGKHGIYIQKGNHNGTYLPHVATQMHWSVEEFVRNCANEKAHIDADGYKDAEIFTYEAIVF